jgi:HK97 gp10 family phage protein
MASARFTYYKAEEARLMHHASGPVGRYLARIAAKVETAAKTRCPVDTGRLRSSINWRMELEGDKLVAIIGTNVEYAIYVHEGTKYMPGRPFLLEGLHQVLGH